MPRAIVVLLFAAGAAASDADAVAERALAAVRTGDAAALRALAAAEIPDPWLVADELCRRREHDVAAAFARASPRKAVEGLPAYVAARRDRPTPLSLRRARDRATALLGKDPAQAAAALADVVPGDDVVSIRATCVRADAYRRVRRYADSERDYVAAADAAERIGWLFRAGQALHLALHAALRRDAAAEAAAHGRRAVDVLRHAGRAGYLAGTLIDLGVATENSGREDAALVAYREGVAIARRAGHEEWAAHGLNNIANVLSGRGDYLDALETYGESLALLDRLGSRGAATTRMNMGVVHYKLGAYPRALATHERVLQEFREVGDAVGEMRALTNLGNVLLAQARYREAADRFESARAIAQRAGHRPGAAAALHNLGIAQERQGNFATALGSYERAIEEYREVGRPAELAATLSDLGDLHRELREYARARAVMQQALAMLRRHGHRQNIATTVGGLGTVHMAGGAHAEARRCFEEQLRLAEALDSPRSRIDALTNLGNLARDLGKHDEAARRYEAALAVARELATQANVAALCVNLGLVAETRGDITGALSRYGAGLAEAEAAGHRLIAVSALSHMSRAHRTRGDLRAAVDTARRAVETVARIGGGLADEQGTRVRERWADVYETGARAAHALGDPAAVAYFLETGRAANLVETLRLRSALRETVLPTALREAEDEARAAVNVAGWKHRRAILRRNRQDVDSSRAALADAHRELGAVIARIQRTEKATAELLYGHVASLAELRASVGPHEAMILFGLVDRGPLALVLTGDAARVVSLVDARAIADACGALDLPIGPGGRSISRATD